MNKIQKIITLPKLLFVCFLFVGNLASQLFSIATVSTALFLASSQVYAQNVDGDDEEDDDTITTTTTPAPVPPPPVVANNPNSVIVGKNTQPQWATVFATDPDNPSTTNDTQQYVYDTPVTAYVLMPKVAMELGFSTLDTLHERRGENQILSWERCDTCRDEEQVDGQTWVKAWGKTLSLDGKKRLDFATKMYGIKVGHDFSIKKDDKGGHSLTGLYLAYGRANSKFYDQYYAEQNGAGQYILQSSKYTGKGRSELYALGLTHTRYHVNGGYLDLVGQLHWLRGYSVDNQGEKTNKQRGKGFALSAEVGKPFELKELNERQSAWFIEPQAQLIYQYIDFDHFADANRIIAPDSVSAVRGRLGVRLAHNRLTKDDKTRTLYAIANIWHNFNTNHSVRIGTEKLSEKYANTWGEVGVGLQRALGKQTYLYGDVRYEFSFKNHAYEAYRGTIGVKYTWQ
ncbi:autotransporter outer membrane beta-barrel domain-containing protein [Gallibacterium trehalosifermentans]|uniref:Autotransporter outer membrane beta-barrel domain-containing protein n=1 Tax=Gallibacterium trehalosifermentans TaxID=516935 RepID=A0ABV6H2V3_9PAST